MCWRRLDGGGRWQPSVGCSPHGTGLVECGYANTLYVQYAGVSWDLGQLTGYHSGLNSTAYSVTCPNLSHRACEWMKSWVTRVFFLGRFRRRSAWLRWYHLLPAWNQPVALGKPAAGCRVSALEKFGKYTGEYEFVVVVMRKGVEGGVMESI